MSVPLNTNHVNQALYRALKTSLANTYALYFGTLSAHWNIRSPAFIALHKMFEENYERLARQGDEIAERLRQLGYTVESSLHSFATQSELANVDPEISESEMLHVLLKGHRHMIAGLSELSEQAEAARHYSLVDLAGRLLGEHEKMEWFIRSHL